MDYLILAGLGSLCMVLLAIPIIFYKDILLGLRKRMYKKKGLGLVGIVLRSGKIKYLWKQFEDRFVIGGGTYLFRKKCVIEQMGIPTIYYYEGNARPIDMKMGRNNKHDVCPQMFSYMIEKAKAAGSLAKSGQKDISFYLLIGACAGGVISAMLLFNLMTQWDPFIKLLPQILQACGK